MRNFGRIIVSGIVLALTGMALSGCIQSTGLDPQDEELVAEYAAGVIMRYSADKTGGLGDLRPTPAPIPWVDPNEVEPAEPEEPSEETTEEAEDEKPIEEVAGMTDISEGPSVTFNGQDLAAAIGINGFDLSYEGYEVVDMYPESQTDDLTFSMQATEGRKLLVVHLNVINPDSSDKECDALSCNVKYRILINDTERINEQMTILLNDLKSYKDTIPAGEAVDTVLVFEVEEAAASSINRLSLVVVNAEGESVFALN